MSSRVTWIKFLINEFNTICRILRMIFFNLKVMKIFKLLFREVLGNAGFVEYINGTMLFWGCDVKTNEGNRGRLCELPVFGAC